MNHICEHFAVLATFERDGQAEIDRLLEMGWTVAGITSAENSGGVWVMLADPAPLRRTS